MRATLHKLVSAKGYPAAIQALSYDPMLAVRGLVVDQLNGNIFKPDRYGFPGRARHGLASMERAKVSELYQRDRTRLSNRRYAWIDSLFALPEAVLYAVLVDYFDRQADGEPKPTYTTLWENIRECIDLAHRDGSIKAIVSTELPSYIERDDGARRDVAQAALVGEANLLLTNSAWDYTYGGDELPAGRGPRRGTVGVRSAYPSWRNYFDVIVVRACKPEFFTEDRPFVELDADGERTPATPKPRSSAGGSTRGGTSGRFRSAPTPRATGCCTSETTSTATCCARESRPTGARPWCCRSWSTR